MEGYFVATLALLALIAVTLAVVVVVQCVVQARLQSDATKKLLDLADTIGWDRLAQRRQALAAKLPDRPEPEMAQMARHGNGRGDNIADLLNPSLSRWEVAPPEPPPE